MICLLCLLHVLCAATVDKVFNGTAKCSVTPNITRPGAAGPVDVYFLSDTTGSMGSAIASVQSSALSIVAAFKAVAPDIRFGFGEYKDGPDEGDPFTFR